MEFTVNEFRQNQLLMQGLSNEPRARLDRLPGHSSIAVPSHAEIAKEYGHGLTAESVGQIHRYFRREKQRAPAIDEALERPLTAGDLDDIRSYMAQHPLHRDQLELAARKFGISAQRIEELAD